MRCSFSVEPVIADGMEPYVHHMCAFSCSNDMGETEAECDEFFNPANPVNARSPSKVEELHSCHFAVLLPLLCLGDL